MSRVDLQRLLAETSLGHVEYREETGSTNDLALTLLGEQHLPPLPLIVLAERQTRGRGRGGNPWWAAEGALTFSLVLDAAALGLAPGDWPRISLATGLGVCEALETLLPSCSLRLKWPNDVFLEGRKVCGILVEAISRRPGLIVIGVGLNVNNSFREAPVELQSIATSLIDVTHRQLDRTDVLIQQLHGIEDRILLLGAGREVLADAWRRRCMLAGRTLTIEAGQRRWTGVCHGIDNDGALLLQTEGGIERCVTGVVARIL